MPIHWATFRLAPHPWAEPAERLLVAAAEAGVQVAIPRPGGWWSRRSRRTRGVVAVVRRLRRAAGVVVALALTACGAPTQQSDPALSSAPPQLIPAMPLPADAVGKAVARLDGLAADLMSSSGIPGMAVAVVHGGKTIYAKGFGVRDTRTGKVDADTVFQLASLSKPVAAPWWHIELVPVPIGWDTPVTGKLPWFALSDPAVTRMLTVGDLFAHRSGLPDHAGDLLEDLGYDRRTVLERMRLLPLAPFRDSYAATPTSG